MQKLFIILLACLISVAIVPLGNAQTPDGIPADEETVCDDAGLTGSAWDLCNAYCQAQDCDEFPGSKSCEMLKKNYAKHTGVTYFPCDIIACALCGDPDPDNITSTIGECVEIPAVECVEPALAVGEYSCDEVTIPADMTPGCANIDPSWGLIPNCQNGMPGWVCEAFLGGTVVDQCPTPPSCFE